jgi:chromosome segregation ATPase
MTKTDQILNELRAGKPLKQIQGKYNSKAQLYEALGIYISEADLKIQKRQNQLSSLNSEIVGIQQKLNLFNTQASQLKKEIDDAEKVKVQMGQEIARLEGELEEKKCELNQINTNLSELAKIGVTPEIVTRIKGMELEFGEDLLERVKTVVDYMSIHKVVENLNKEKTSLEDETAGLEKKKNHLISDIQTEKNRLDESKLKTQTFKEAIAMTVYYFTNGYDTADLKSLKDGLDLLGVKGDPKLSITRLVKGLERIKTLVNLEDTVKEYEKKLQTLNENIAKAEGELYAIRDITVNAIKEAADYGRARASETWENTCTQIRNTGKESIRKITELGENSEKTLGNLSQKVETTISETGKVEGTIAETLKTETEKSAKKFDACTEKALRNFDTHVSETMNSVKKDFEEWGNVKERVGKYEERIGYANTLLGILETPEMLKTVPLQLIARLMNRLYLWASMLLAGETMTPSENIQNKEWQLATYKRYQLPVIFEWCSEELERRMREAIGRSKIREVRI